MCLFLSLNDPHFMHTCIYCNFLWKKREEKRILKKKCIFLSHKFLHCSKADRKVIWPVKIKDSVKEIETTSQKSKMAGPSGFDSESFKKELLEEIRN